MKAPVFCPFSLLATLHGSPRAQVVLCRAKEDGDQHLLGKKNEKV